MIGFAKRNLLVFFKDRTAVFFSMLAVFIIVGLYALFLGDVWVSSFDNFPGVRFVVDSWLMSGIVAVTSVTSTMGAFGTMVEDKARKISKDIVVSPLSRSSIAGGYILSSYLIGVIMSIVTLALAEVYVVANGGALLSFPALLKVLGLILLSCFMNTSMIFFLTSFFKSLAAFSTASTVIGTLIGFLTGMYVPIGQLPDAVQWVVKLFPVSHSVTLFKQVMMEAPMAAAFASAPAEIAQKFKEAMGVVLKYGEAEATAAFSLACIALTAVVFSALSVYRMAKKTD